MILDRFMDILTAEKGYSAHTCRAYRSDILDFMRFLPAGQMIQIRRRMCSLVLRQTRPGWTS